MRLRLRDSGARDAPAVILLHGFGASLDTWEPWARALSARYRVIRLDLPGFGLTGPDPSGDYSDARAMRILLDLMGQLGIDRASVPRPRPRTRCRLGRSGARYRGGGVTMRLSPWR